MKGLHDDSVRQRLAPMQPRTMTFKSIHQELRVISEEARRAKEVRRQKYFLQQQTAVQNPKQTDDCPPAAAPSVNLQSISTSTPIKQVDEIERDQLTNLTEMMRRQLATLNHDVEVHMQATSPSLQDISAETDSPRRSDDDVPVSPLTEETSKPDSVGSETYGTSCMDDDNKLRDVQQEDRAISRVLHLKATRHSRLSQRQARREEKGIQRLLRSWDHLQVKSGLLVFSKEEGNSRSCIPVLPRSMHQTVLKNIHDEMGHLVSRRLSSW